MKEDAKLEKGCYVDGVTLTYKGKTAIPLNFGRETYVREGDVITITVEIDNLNIKSIEHKMIPMK